MEKLFGLSPADARTLVLSTWGNATNPPGGSVDLWNGMLIAPLIGGVNPEIDAAARVALFDSSQSLSLTTGTLSGQLSWLAAAQGDETAQAGLAAAFPSLSHYQLSGISWF